jgi:hypothetical protein
LGREEIWATALGDGLFRLDASPTYVRGVSRASRPPPAAGGVGVCGQMATVRSADLDVLNFERHKWGVSSGRLVTRSSARFHVTDGG